MNTNRDLEIDCIKGILIILVVLGHAIQYASGSDYMHRGLYLDNPVFLIIYSFHMPLFALISGFLFDRSNKRKFIEVVIRKIKGVFVPLSIFCALALLWEIHINESMTITQPVHILSNYIKNLYGWPLWYLGTILLDSFIIALLSRLTSCKPFNELTMWFVFVVSFFIPDEFIISIHKFIYPFFLIGYLMSSRGVELCKPYKKSFRSLEIVILVILSLGLLMFFDKEYLVYISGFSIKDDINVLWVDMYRMLVGLIISRFLCILIPMIINNKEIKWLTVLGRNTLGIYCFQTLLYLVVPSFVYHFHINNGIIGPVVCFILVLSISYVITQLCEKYIPCMIGK